MNADALPPSFAPFHLVLCSNRTTMCCGLFHDLGVAASSLQFIRRQCPDDQWALVDDKGFVDDTKIVPREFQYPIRVRV